MSQANAEQLPAIQHHGGVLLKAGAGSGKTFVLVEHVLHLTREWHQDWERNGAEQAFADFIGQRFSSTVLMTFTKLAAGEISVRLTNRFQRAVAEAPEEEQAWWAQALAQLDRLTVTTIDGFFYKLVRRGYFPKLPPDLPIIMEGPRRKRLLSLFDTWWEQESDRLTPDARRDLAIHREALIETLLDIFNNPALRDAWMHFSPDEARPEALGWLAEELFKLEGWSGFLELAPVTVPAAARAKNNKWVALADALAARPRLASTWPQILEWEQFIQSEVGQTKLVLGGSKEEVAYYFDAWRDFKKSIAEWARTFRQYQASFDEKILPWYQTIVGLVRHIDQSLSPADGLTYGDLEYHVLNELRLPATASRVRKDFTYFVVDEFQDTSRIQFEVIRLLCGGEASRLFCVGDAKQAIYGFRGGELKVFTEMEQDRAVTTLPLVSNYRSRPEVVRFNNAFFTALFPIGKGWQGLDGYAVEMENQATPAEAAAAIGEVIVLDVALPPIGEVDPSEASKKSPQWRSSHLNRAEAVLIADEIQRRLPELGEGSIAILYRWLTPTSAMMTELMRRGIGFTAQAKIPFSQDPIAGMLYTLLQDVLGQKSGEWASYMTMGYLRLLGIQPGPEVGQAVGAFAGDIALYGPGAAFDLFLARLGLANALYQSNLKEVKEILELGAGNIERIWSRLREVAEKRWSADFRFGVRPERVILQTSHGSKGLEYDVVFVAGLSTNGRDNARFGWIGSLPGSVQWVEDAGERRREPTPQMAFEKEWSKQKAFAESKRLFYVACTRAKAALIFTRLHCENESQSGESSWGAGLEAFLDRAVATPLQRVPLRLSASSLTTGEGSALPFFHLNPLGLSRKEGFTAGQGQGVTAELSVTRLGDLLDCPRKFYFRNVLKLAEDSGEDPLPELTAFSEEPEPRPLSSSERGSAIHLALSQAIKHNFVLPIEWVDRRERPLLEWVLAELRQHAARGDKLISEETFKFPLFGFMLTAIPDLLVLSEKNRTAEVWDFKTGRRGPHKEARYWQQLESYAYGLWKRGLVNEDTSILLKLAYVDEKVFVPREVSFTQVKDSLFQQWSLLGRLERANLDHCETCPYRGICPR